MLNYNQAPQYFETLPQTVATTLTSVDLPIDNQNTRIYFKFSDTLDFATLIVPSAGTCTCTASPDGTNYRSISGGTAFSLATADLPSLSAAGMVKKVKAVPTGTATATYWKMLVVSY